MTQRYCRKAVGSTGNSTPCPGHDGRDKMFGNSQPHSIGKQVQAAW